MLQWLLQCSPYMESYCSKSKKKKMEMLSLLEGDFRVNNGFFTKIWRCLHYWWCSNCFWKSVLFLEKCQKFQKLCCPVLVTWSRVNPVVCPQSQAYSVGLRDSLASQSPSCEKDLENFSKILGFRFLATLFGNLLASGSFSRELTQKFSQLLSQLPNGWKF